ncbi:hypothetical protein [Geomonas subterranea]|uniref:hypothetical protein n=1 Tax=Geomonas subterranea TaxID=2847989 RepID=UPI001CD6CB7A|nr:hypothetical protein [Geomonas fuzhouensis]
MMKGQIVRSGAHKGCINFGIVQADSREARLYPLADEFLDALVKLEAEVQRLKAVSPEVADMVDDAVVGRASALIESVKG